MPEKKLIQDMVPIKIHKIRDVPEANLHRVQPAVEHEPFRHFKEAPSTDGKKKKKWLLAIVGLLCLVVIFFAITYVYTKAVVIITPKVEHISVNGTFTATKNSGPLLYSLVETSESASTTIDAQSGNSSANLIEKKAWGLVVFYNTFGSSSIKLPVGTHITNGIGQVYTTYSAITIPGMHNAVPGTASVNIVASEAGEDYNMKSGDPADDFHVDAFVGSSKYLKVTAHLKTGGAVIGGYSGYDSSVTSNTLNATLVNLRQSISDQLASDRKTLVPDGYVLYNQAYTTAFSTSTVSTVGSSTVVSLTGTLYGIIFKKMDLSKAVAPNQTAEFPTTSLVIRGIESLNFVPTDMSAFATALKSQNGAPVTFTLSGVFDLIGTFPSATVAQSLRGLSMAQSKAVFASYSTIASAHAIISPFWIHSFPGTTDKIYITVQN